jgi:hypothetical protein
MQDCVFDSHYMCSPCLPNGLESTTSQQLHTNGILLVVRCLLFMVACALDRFAQGPLLYCATTQPRTSSLYCKAWVHGNKLWASEPSPNLGGLGSWCCTPPIGVATPLWAKCEDETHTPKSGNLESSGTPATLELNSRGQNTSPWTVLYTVGKVLKFRCPKWPRMSHLDICSPSYGQKKGQESNWQFDSRPLKVRNRPDSDVYKRNATWRWKALKDRYKISLDLILIGSLTKKLWMPKVPRVQPRTISGLLLGSLGKKCHSDVASAGSCKEYYMGEGGGFPRVRAVVSPRSPVVSPNTKRVQNEF